MIGLTNVSVSVLLVEYPLLLLLLTHPAWVLVYMQKIESTQCDCLFVILSLMRDNVKGSCVQLPQTQRTVSKLFVEKNKGSAWRDYGIVEVPVKPEPLCGHVLAEKPYSTSCLKKSTRVLSPVLRAALAVCRMMCIAQIRLFLPRRPRDRSA